MSCTVIRYRHHSNVLCNWKSKCTRSRKFWSTMEFLILPYRITHYLQMPVMKQNKWLPASGRATKASYCSDCFKHNLLPLQTRHVLHQSSKCLWAHPTHVIISDKTCISVTCTATQLLKITHTGVQIITEYTRCHVRHSWITVTCWWKNKWAPSSCWIH